MSSIAKNEKMSCYIDKNCESIIEISSVDENTVHINELIIDTKKRNISHQNISKETMLKIATYSKNIKWDLYAHLM